MSVLSILGTKGYSNYFCKQRHTKTKNHLTHLEAKKSMSDLITSWIGLLGDAGQTDSSLGGAEITGTLVGDITVSQVPTELNSLKIVTHEDADKFLQNGGTLNQEFAPKKVSGWPNITCWRWNHSQTSRLRWPNWRLKVWIEYWISFCNRNTNWYNIWLRLMTK